MTQASLFDAPTLTATQQEVVEALRRLITASDSSDIQGVLADYRIPRERNTIAKRLCELEELGLVERRGRRKADDGQTRTVWGLR